MSRMKAMAGAGRGPDSQHPGPGAVRVTEGVPLPAGGDEDEPGGGGFQRLIISGDQQAAAQQQYSSPATLLAHRRTQHAPSGAAPPDQAKRRQLSQAGALTARWDDLRQADQGNPVASAGA
jgi:hypothetical protein